MEKIVAIVLNGEGLEAEQLKKALKDVSIIIAADGGANYCLQQKIQAHYIIGDLDSIKQKSRDSLGQAELIHLGDQYSTDLEKALKLAESLKPDKLRILNATGKRGDHTIANLLFLQQMSKQIKVEIIDNFGQLTFLEAGKHQFDLQKGKTVSFMSVGPLKNLTLTGFQYPLQNASFENFFVGISNVVEEVPCNVSFEAGTLMMYEVDRLE